MPKREKKRFKSVGEIFETYIPGYVPPDERKSGQTEKQANGGYGSEFTRSLLDQFERRIKAQRSG